MEQVVGEITHFYDKISVAVVRLEAELRVGDIVHIKGKVTDFENRVESMQMNHTNVSVAQKGDEVAIEMNKPAKEGDRVYKK